MSTRQNTQLPAEWLETINLKAEHEAALQFHPVYSPDQNTACRICYRNGAKEYAATAHQVQQENESLTNQLKKRNLVADENMKVLNQLHEKAQREIEELKQTIELHLKSLSIRNEYVVKAMALLKKVIYRHEGGLLPDRLLYNEIKTFLDGTK